MSPEQAQGKHVDRRTDIWAFGAVLFEMLSGRQAFNGGTTVEVLSSVLKTDPDWSGLPPATPVGVRSLIRRCLQKEPGRRLRDIADARYQIEEALSDPSGAPGLPRTHGSRTRERLLWVAALMTVAAVVAATVWSLRQPQGDEVRFEISPDGKWIAYQSDESGQMEIYVHSFQGPARKTAITNGGGAQARWSADGRELFYLTRDARLMAVRIRPDSNGVEVGKPTPLFLTHPMFPATTIGVRSYAVSPDGQRFLVDTLKETTTPITVLLNWKPKP